MKTKIVTPYSYEYNPDKHRVFETASKTVPGQTMSLREILDRYARGMKPVGNPNPPQFYDEDIPPVNIGTLDLTERAELREQLSQQIEAIKQTARDKAKPKEKLPTPLTLEGMKEIIAPLIPKLKEKE